MAKKPRRQKHEPLRSCVACGRKRPKKELVRVVRTPAGAIEPDPTGRLAGRGAYVCPDPGCLEVAVKGRKLERALKVPVPEEVLQALAVTVAGMEASDDGGGRDPTKG